MVSLQDLKKPFLWTQESELIYHSCSFMPPFIFKWKWRRTHCRFYVMSPYSWLGVSAEQHKPLLEGIGAKLQTVLCHGLNDRFHFYVSRRKWIKGLNPLTVRQAEEDSSQFHGESTSQNEMLTSRSSQLPPTQHLLISPATNELSCEWKMGQFLFERQGRHKKTCHLSICLHLKTHKEQFHTC